jgi:hypothetical protein
MVSYGEKVAPYGGKGSAVWGKGILHLSYVLMNHLKRFGMFYV